MNSLGQYLYNTHHHEAEEDVENRTPSNRKQQQGRSSSKRGGGGAHTNKASASAASASPSGMGSFISDASPSPTRRLLFAAVDRSDTQRAPFQALEDLAPRTPPTNHHPLNSSFVSASSGGHSATKTPHSQAKLSSTTVGVSPIFRSASPKQRREGEANENEQSPVFFLSDTEEEEEEEAGDSPGAFHPEEEADKAVAAAGAGQAEPRPAAVYTPHTPSRHSSTESVRGSSIAPLDEGEEKEEEEEEEAPLASPPPSSPPPPPPPPPATMPATPAGPPPSVDGLLARAQAVHTPEVVKDGRIKGWISERLSSAIKKFVWGEEEENRVLDTSSLCAVGEGGESIRGDCEEEDTKASPTSTRAMDVSALASPQFLQQQQYQDINNHNNTAIPHKGSSYGKHRITTASIEKCPQLKHEALLRGGFPAARPQLPTSSPLVASPAKKLAAAASFCSSSLTAAATAARLAPVFSSSAASMWSASSSSSSSSSAAPGGAGAFLHASPSSSTAHEHSRSWGAASACSRHRPELRGGGNGQVEEEEEAIRRQMLALSMTDNILAAREEKKEKEKGGKGKQKKKREAVPTSILDVLSMASSSASSLSFFAASASRGDHPPSSTFSFTMPESSDEEEEESTMAPPFRSPPAARLPQLYSPPLQMAKARPQQQQQRQPQGEKKGRKTFAALLQESESTPPPPPKTASSSLSASLATPIASAAAPLTWEKLMVGCAASRELLLRNCRPGPCSIQTFISYHTSKEDRRAGSSDSSSSSSSSKKKGFEVRCGTGTGGGVISADGILRLVVTFRPVVPGVHRATLHLRVAERREGEENLESGRKRSARVYEVELAGTAANKSSHHSRRPQEHDDEAKEPSVQPPSPTSFSAVGFAQGLLNFGRHPQGSVVVHKVKLCNPLPVPQLVVLESVTLPFVLTHRVIKLKPRAFVQLPIRFVPVHNSGAFATTLRASVHALVDGEDQEPLQRRSRGQSIALELRGLGGPREE